MDFDWVGSRMHIFGFFIFLELHLNFFKMSFWEKIDCEYVLNISKLPERRAIDPDNSPTMKKLKLSLVTEVKCSVTFMVLNA